MAGVWADSSVSQQGQCTAGPGEGAPLFIHEAFPWTALCWEPLAGQWGLQPVLTPWGLSSQCAKDSAHGGWDSVNTCNNYVTARPQPKAKAPWKATGQQPGTTMTPPTPPLLLQPAKWGNGMRTSPKMPRPSGSPQPSPGPRASGSTPREDMAGSTVSGLSPRPSVLETPGSGGRNLHARVCTFLESRQFPNLLPVSEASVSVYVPFFLHPRASLAGTSAVSLSSGGTCWAFPVQPGALG